MTELARRFGRLIARRVAVTARRLTKQLARAGGYRPEKHYMRGPGPKSHLKNTSERRKAA